MKKAKTVFKAGVINYEECGLIYVDKKRAAVNAMYLITKHRKVEETFFKTNEKVAYQTCLTKAPDVRIKILENVYETVCQSRYGVTKQGSEGCAKNVMRIQRRFANTLLKTPTFSRMELQDWNRVDTTGETVH